MKQGPMRTPDFPAVVVALQTLFRNAWPEAPVEAALERAAVQVSFVGFRQALEPAFMALERLTPSAAVWCKDEESNFFAASPNFVRASMLDEAVLFSGINDHDLRLPWGRQAAIYVRDDREVFTTRKPKLHIVQRQDQLLTTRWLKASKVPFVNAIGSGGTGGTVGGYEVISDKEAWALRRASYAARCGPVFDVPWARAG